MNAALLPLAFAELEPWAPAWCLATEPERWERRLQTPMPELQAFYDACFPRAEAAIAYCDRFALDEEALEPNTRESVLFVDPTRRVRHSDLEHRLCEIDRYLCSLHRAPPP